MSDIPEPIEVEFSIIEQTYYTGYLVVDPVEFEQLRGKPLSEATGIDLQIYENVNGYGFEHIEKHDNVLGQEWYDIVKEPLGE